ncbi:MAG: F0F1 ATP synthase subunit A [Verrucomicrobiota bacterium]|nr:F0F1 ATP synthase subunit A [Verrucomicrobiota bacterium]
MAFRFHIRLLLALLFAAFVCVAGVNSALAQEHGAHSISTTAPTHGDAHGGDEHHTLSLKAVELFHIGKFTITNSMLVTWTVALLIIGFAQYATRNIKPIPTGAQNFWEWLVEGLYNFLGGVIGSDLVKRTFWFFATTFIFILTLNWFGLIPGVGTIGWGHTSAATGNFIIDRALLRGANADLNLTFAMASVFFVLWIVWAVQMNGPGGVLMHIFGPKGKSTGFLRVLLLVIFFLVGILEVVSILFRPISLSFRLYGNVYAGEVMLESMAAVAPKFLTWLVPIPFYFLELLVGLVQALVFMLLTGVFTLLIAPHDPAHEHH